MKKYLFLLLLLSLCVGFTACSSDDDDGGNNTELNEQKLIGMWEMKHIQGSVNGESFDEEVDGSHESLKRLYQLDVCDYVRYEFSSGSIITVYKFLSSEFKKTGSAPYSLRNNILTVSTGDKMTIKSLTDNQLVIYSEVPKDNLSITVTMKRVK